MTRRIHLVLRSYGGENDKNRPPYYSKLLTLTSFIRAAKRVPEAEVLFLNDGPVPDTHRALMERYGTVVEIPDGPIGLRGSYLRGITLPQHNPDWDDDDLVSLNEDDYLFCPDAFVLLAEAADQLPEVSYFSVYGPKPDYDSPSVRTDLAMPHGWHAAPDRTVNGRTWFNQPGITSTFTARAGALRRDEAVFRHCMIPFRHRFLDHETCLIYQGFVPYRGLDLITGLPRDFVPGVRGVVRPHPVPGAVPDRLGRACDGATRTPSAVLPDPQSGHPPGRADDLARSRLGGRGPHPPGLGGRRGPAEHRGDPLRLTAR